MQCPYYQRDRDEMYDEMYNKCPNAMNVLDKESFNVAYYLLGKKMVSVDDNEMLYFWCLAGNAISKMYRKAVASRTGVG